MTIETELFINVNIKGLSIVIHTIPMYYMYYSLGTYIETDQYSANYLFKLNILIQNITSDYIYSFYD